MLDYLGVCYFNLEENRAYVISPLMETEADEHVLDLWGSPSDVISDVLVLSLADAKVWGWENDAIYV